MLPSSLPYKNVVQLKCIELKSSFCPSHNIVDIISIILKEQVGNTWPCIC